MSFICMAIKESYSIAKAFEEQKKGSYKSKSNDNN